MYSAFVRVVKIARFGLARDLIQAQLGSAFKLTFQASSKSPGRMTYRFFLTAIKHMLK
jgi:hypothetical protein